MGRYGFYGYGSRNVYGLAVGFGLNLCQCHCDAYTDLRSKSDSGESMNSKVSSCLLLIASTLVPLTTHAQKKASFWLTNPDMSALFQPQATSLPFSKSVGTNP